MLLITPVLITITGFSNFGDVHVNPTQKLIEHFKNDNRITKESQILDTSLDAVDRFIDSMDNSQMRTRHLFIHMGVDIDIERFQIEQLAYNKNDFSIPDNNGAHPLNEFIDESIALDAPFETNFPTKAMLTLLSDDNIIAYYSSYADRFVCNYLYYRSMQHYKDCANVNAVFIHAPPEEECDIEEQIHFVDRFIDIWTASFAA